jgi:uncharacterized protein YjbI with pentapeptide repeats
LGAYLDSADLRGACLWEAHLDSAYLSGANLSNANLRSAYLRGADLTNANLRKANLDGANLRGAILDGADLSQVRSYFKAILDPDILSEIKGNWPEKLAIFWDYGKKDWVIDDTLLQQIKKPDWYGWSEEKDQGK